MNNNFASEAGSHSKVVSAATIFEERTKILQELSLELNVVLRDGISERLRSVINKTREQLRIINKKMGEPIMARPSISISIPGGPEMISWGHALARELISLDADLTSASNVLRDDSDGISEGLSEAEKRPLSKGPWQSLTGETRKKLIKSLMSSAASCQITYQVVNNKIPQEEDPGGSWQPEIEELFAGNEHLPLIVQAIHLIRQPDFDPEWEGLELLKMCDLTASTRYNRIHEAGTYQFSKRNRPNPQALLFGQTTGIGKDSRVLDLGCGSGHDSMAFAKAGAALVYAMDNSPFILNQLKKSLKSTALSAVQPIQMDFSQIVHADPEIRGPAILSLEQMKLTHIYSHSTLHYFPRAVLLKYFRMLHRILKGQNGYFGVFMRTPHSDFADPSKRQIRINGSGELILSMDREDRIMRIHPTQEQFIQLLAVAGFTCIESDRKIEDSFAVTGLKDVFAGVIAQAV